MKFGMWIFIVMTVKRNTSTVSDSSPTTKISLDSTAEFLLDMLKYYKTKSIYFVYDSQRHPTKEHRLTTLRKILKREFISFAFVSLEYVLSHKDKRHETRGNALCILFTIDAFKKLCSNQIFETPFPSRFTWLVFADELSRVREVVSEIYLSIIYEVLFGVHSEKSVTLYEVYNSRKGVPETVSHFGTWTSDAGFRGPHATFHARRGNLMGARIAAASFTTDVDAKVKVRAVDRGFDHIVNVLSEIMNFTIERKLPERIAYGSQMSNGTWTGAVGLIKRGEAEIATISLVMTENRFTAVDFTFPLGQSRYCIIIKKPGAPGFRWNTFHSPFSTALWFVYCAFTFTLVSLLLVYKHFVNDETSSKTSIASLYILGASFCGQGMPTISRSSSIHLLFLTTHFMHVMLIGAYSAFLISYLMDSKMTLPFNSIEGLLDHGSYTVEMTEGSSQLDILRTAKSGELLRMAKKICNPSNKKFPSSITIGLRTVCNTKNYAYILIDDITRENMHAYNCEFAVLPESFMRVQLAIALRKGDPLREIINYNLAVMKSSGIIRKFLQPPINQMGSSHREKIPFRSVELYDVSLLFILLIFGIFGSLVLLVIEIIKRKYSSIK